MSSKYAHWMNLRSSSIMIWSVLPTHFKTFPAQKFGRWVKNSAMSKKFGPFVKIASFIPFNQNMTKFLKQYQNLWKFHVFYVSYGKNTGDKTFKNIWPLFGHFWENSAKFCHRFLQPLTFLLGPFWVMRPKNLTLILMPTHYLIDCEINFPMALMTEKATHLMPCRPWSQLTKMSLGPLKAA